MQGRMLWFNADKGYGFIQTEDAERLYVARSGFCEDHEPKQRCKGQTVTFERTFAEGDTQAINVTFVEAASQRRARLHHPRGGTSL